MTIGFDAKRAFQNRTGLGNYSRMVITALATQHPEVDIVLFTPRREGDFANHFDSFPQVRIVEPNGLWRLMPSLWRTLALGSACRCNNVELFHGLSHELPLFMPKKIRQVVTMHDLIAWRYPRQFHAVDRIIYHLKFRHACRHADRVVAVSQQTRHDLIERLHVPEAKIQVVYQSCDPIFYQTVTDAQCNQVRQRYQLPERYLICIGTIEPRKNQVAAVRALALLPADIHLVIVGRRTAYYETVFRAVEECNLQQRVHFLRDAAFADFPALYTAAEAALYVSLFEGFGIPVLEALCCQTPVVAANTSSLPEVGGDAACYADPNSPKDIAEQVNNLLENDTLRSQMREAAVRQRDKFLPERIIADLYAIYSGLAYST